MEIHPQTSKASHEGIKFNNTFISNSVLQIRYIILFIYTGVEISTSPLVRD